MHKSAKGHTREEIVEQVEDKESSVKEFDSYIPVGKAAQKLTKWYEQGAEICYLTSRRKHKEVEDIRNVLKKHDFPEGNLLFRKDGEEYKDVVEKVVPDVFIEDDCESIGEEEITITHVKLNVRGNIKSILIKEFAGIDHLPDKIDKLLNLTGFFVIIRGPLACGKSTIAKRLAKILNAEYIPVDRVLDEHNLINDWEDGYISQKSFRKANEIVAPKLKEKLQSGVLVVFDGNFYWKSQVDDLIKRLDFPHHVFTLKAPLSVCIERDVQRGKTHGEDAARAVYKKATEFDYGTVIDISKSLDEAIQDIVNCLPNMNESGTK